MTIIKIIIISFKSKGIEPSRSAPINEGTTVTTNQNKGWFLGRGQDQSSWRETCWERVKNQQTKPFALMKGQHLKFQSHYLFMLETWPLSTCWKPKVILVFQFLTDAAPPFVSKLISHLCKPTKDEEFRINPKPHCQRASILTITPALLPIKLLQQYQLSWFHV